LRTTSKPSTNLIRPLCRVAAALCSGNEEQLGEAFNLALDGGIDSALLREVVLTAYLFDGYPAALEGFRVLASLVGTPRTVIRNGYTAEEVALWRRRGEDLCRLIYGQQYQKLTEHVCEIAPELADAMIVEGYGKVLARENLEPRLRELAVVAMLAAKYRPRQLLSHCLGAMRLGATEADLRLALDSAAICADEGNIARSRLVLDQALTRMRK
jgi:4-carboxymuconolactone decarboxylase